MYVLDFHDMINIKSFDPNNFKKYGKPCQNVLICYISYVIPNNVKRFHLIINNANGYIEEGNGNKYLTLVSTKGSFYMLKMFEEIWTEIKDLIRSANNSSDNYSQTYLKIKFNSEKTL